MKKTYMNPTVEVIEMQYSELLAGSDPEYSIQNEEISEFEYLE